MLTLTRKEGEGIYIGRNIRLTVLELYENDAGDLEIRLGVEAPQFIAVSRDDFTFEQHLRFQQQRETASRRA